MSTVTVSAGVSGVVEDVVFTAPETATREEEAHGGTIPSPYDYLLMALGA